MLLEKTNITILLLNIKIFNLLRSFIHYFSFVYGLFSIRSFMITGQDGTRYMHNPEVYIRSILRGHRAITGSASVTHWGLLLMRTTCVLSLLATSPTVKEIQPHSRPPERRGVQRVSVSGRTFLDVFVLVPLSMGLCDERPIETFGWW